MWKWTALSLALVACNPSAPGPSASPQARGPAQTATFAIEGMTCDSCAQAITETLERHPGVVSAQVSFDTRTAVVRYAGTSPDALEAAIESLGYEAEPSEAEGDGS